MSLEFNFVCPLPNGVHARPASAFEEIARAFGAEVILTNARTGRAANGKSVLAIVGADIRNNDPCLMKISGPDEAEAMAVLSGFLTREFPHCDDALPPAPARSSNGKSPLPPVLRETSATVRHGLPVVSGIGQGEVVQIFGLQVPASIPLTGNVDFAAEIRTVDAALTSLVDHYEERMTRHTSQLERDLLKAHRSVARDPEFRAKLHESLRQPGRTAAGAIADAEAHFTSILAASDSLLLRERALDVRDVCSQLLRQIHGKQAGAAEVKLPDAAIVLAETLTPGQFLRLDRSRLKGLVLGHAGTTSHTVILARSFGIPTLTGIPELASARLHGREAILDGDAGLLVTDLTESIRKHYGKEQKRLAARRAYQRRFIHEPGMTSDGHRVEVAGNAATAEEAAAVFAEGAEGIGLLRTEMLFLDRDTPPDEAEQLEEYQSILREAGHRPVIIRTVDIGGDKPLPYLKLPSEENPFLGYRAVRIYPEFESLFRTQIRALVRASAHGTLKVMIPMVTSMDEVRWVRRIIKEEQARCAGQGIAFNPRMPVGAMIEVPAAAFLLDKLCQELDFFSIGSNDLLQYFAAADRANPRLTRLQNRLQPAFLRLLKKIVDDVHAAGKWVGICGEMGAQAPCVPLLVGFGVDEISVATTAVMALKAELASWPAAACRELAAEALNRETAEEVMALTEQHAARRLAPLIASELVLLDADCATKEDAIEHAVNQLYVVGRSEHPNLLEQAIWQREAAYSTGFGHGFAIPHCKSDAVLTSSLVILKLRTPVDWGSLDHQPVNFIILMAIREAEQANAHMKILSRLARKVMDEGFRAELVKADEPGALCAFLRSNLEV